MGIRVVCICCTRNWTKQGTVRGALQEFWRTWYTRQVRSDVAVRKIEGRIIWWYDLDWFFLMHTMVRWKSDEQQLPRTEERQKVSVYLEQERLEDVQGAKWATSSAGALREVTCKQTTGLKIEREKAALMHVNKKSATLMRATKASDKSRSILEVSESKRCG